MDLLTRRTREDLENLNPVSQHGYEHGAFVVLCESTEKELPDYGFPESFIKVVRCAGSALGPKSPVFSILLYGLYPMAETTGIH